MIVQKDLTFALDTPEAVPVGSRDYFLNGWCFTKLYPNELEIIASVDGIAVPGFLGFYRPDVAEYFHDPSLTRSGFIVRFRPPPDAKTVTLSGRLNGVVCPLTENIPVPGRKTNSSVHRRTALYEQWITEKESELFWPEEEIADRLFCLDYRPTISVILPTYNTPPYFLKRCIQSVLEQHYANWQLCIVDDHSSDTALLTTLQQYARLDSRIVVTQCSEQAGISGASNLALKQAGGDFIVLLDHDDELHPFALLELVRELNVNSELGLVYSDEDKIDLWGIRSQPALKPDFDRDILLPFNYLGHLISLKRSLVNEIGGFRSNCDGAQDWDLLIRATEALDSTSVGHIRKPLYHWRMHDDSTSVNLDAKPYAAKAWTRVLQDHMIRTGKKAEITEGLFYGSMRVKHPAPRNLEVGVFLRSQDPVFQAAVVRLSAGRRVLHLYETLDCLVFEKPEEGRAAFWAAANGASGPQPASLYSITETKGDVIVFINGPLDSLNHLFFEELVAQCMRRDCGLVTGLSLDSHNHVIASGFLRTGQNELLDPYMGQDGACHGYMGQLSVVRSIDACPDTFFAVRREYLANVGGLGALSAFHMTHLVKRLARNALEKGLLILFTPYAVATFTDISKLVPQEPSKQQMPIRLKVNPQFLAFRQVDEALLRETQ